MSESVDQFWLNLLMLLVQFASIDHNVKFVVVKRQHFIIELWD